MAGDYNRIPDGLFRHFSSVLMQQGRVHLDSDWNEMARLAEHRWTTQADDTFGPAAVPRQTTPQGFALTAVSGTPADLLVGAGRCYVDGLQAELFPGETVDGKAVSYLNQPFLPSPPAISASGIAYLDVWEREVTSIEAPSLLDPALGGVDTTARMQTVWQVKLLTTDPTSNNPASCSTDLNAVFPPSAARLTTAANAPQVATDPCILPDHAGYRGIENRLYRVQIHTAGNAVTARWKWSRENASVVSRVTKISTAGVTTLTLDRTGRDAVLRVSANDWVEITDDALELTGQPGLMAQIVGQPNDTSGTVVLDRALPATFNPADSTRHTRLIRWDQQQGVAAEGLLPIAAGPVELEDGVMVTLALDPSQSGGSFLAGDWWSFAARTADASVQILTAAAPFGIRHHYCALATIAVSGGAVSVTGDCRILWPPQTGAGTDCCCTVCVTADGHNSGQATLAMALETVRRKGGGRVCLGPGLFALQAPLAVSGLADVIISGQGAATILVSLAGGPAVSVDAAFGLRIEDLSFFSLSPAATTVPIGILVSNSVDVAIQRCSIAALAPQVQGEATFNPARAALRDFANTSSGASFATAVADAVAPASGIIGVRAAAVGGGSTAGPASVGRAAPAPEFSPAVGLAPAGIAIGLDGFVVEVLIGENVLFAELGLAKAALLGPVNGVKLKSLLLVAGLQASGNWILCSWTGVALGDAFKETGSTAYGLQTAITNNFVLGGLVAGIFLHGFNSIGAAVQVATNHIEVAGTGIIAALDGCTIADNHMTQLDAATALSTAAHAANNALTPGILINAIATGMPAIGEVRVLRNRIFGFFGPGIQNTAPIAALALIDNSIAATTGFGIFTFGQVANAVVRGNEVFVVTPILGSEFTKGFASGITISIVANAVVQDNVVAGIASTGTTAAANFSGITISGFSRATLAGNDISDIGQPDDLSNKSVGILALAGQAELTIRGNTVRQSATAQPNASLFSAIVVSALEPVTLEVSICGNALEGSSVSPLVTTRSVNDCVLTDNRCLLTGASSGGVNASLPAVQVQAQTAIVSNNRIQGATGSSFAGLSGLSISVSLDSHKELSATVLGNIVTTGIDLYENSPTALVTALAPPWAVLNIIL